LESLPPPEALDDVPIEENEEVIERDGKHMIQEAEGEEMKEIEVQDSDDQSTPAKSEGHVNGGEPEEGGAATS
jgi:hypothetical protein